MIVIIAQVDFDPAAMPQVRPLLSAMMAATRAEPGCVSYSMAVEDEAAGTVAITERWVDAAALAAHFKMPHMADFMAGTRGLITAMAAKQYDVVNESDVRVE